MTRGRSSSKWAHCPTGSSCCIWADAWNCHALVFTRCTGDPSGDISMAFATDYRRTVLAIIAVACTAVLVWFGTGLYPRWPLLWLAPLPVLLFASRSSWGSTALTAFLSWLLGSLNLWHYFSALLHIPLAIRVEILAIPALVF